MYIIMRANFFESFINPLLNLTKQEAQLFWFITWNTFVKLSAEFISIQIRLKPWMEICRSTKFENRTCISGGHEHWTLELGFKTDWRYFAVDNITTVKRIGTVRVNRDTQNKGSTERGEERKPHVCQHTKLEPPMLCFGLQLEIIAVPIHGEVSLFTKSYGTIDIGSDYTGSESLKCILLLDSIYIHLFVQVTLICSRRTPYSQTVDCIVQG